MIEQRPTLDEKLLVLVIERVVVMGIFVNVSIDRMSSE